MGAHVDRGPRPGVRVAVSSERVAHLAVGRLLAAGYDSTMPRWDAEDFVVRVRGVDSAESDRVLRLIRVLDPAASLLD